MKRKHRAPVDRVKLVFDRDHDPLDTLRTEISACSRVDDTLFLAHDEGSAIERLRRKGTHWKRHKHFELADFFDLPGGADGEMDIEGLAWDAPYLWFTGSMSLKRDTPKAEDDDAAGAARLHTILLDKNRYTLGRIPCKHHRKKGKWTPKRELRIGGRRHVAALLEGGPSSTVLTELLRADPHLEPFMSIPCKDNGFDVEGLAVHRGRVFLGLRGPVIGGWAIVLEFGVHERDGRLRLDSRGAQAKPYRKHFLNLAGMGIRELHVDRANSDLLILAGPTMDLDGTISTWCVRGGLAERELDICRDPQRLYDITPGGSIAHGRDKAEGITVDRDGCHLVVFDSPRDERLIGDNAVLADLYRP